MYYLDYELDEFALWRNSAPDIYVTGTVAIAYTSPANWRVESARVRVYNTQTETEADEACVGRDDFLCLLIDGALNKFERLDIEQAIENDAAAQAERIREERASAW